MRGFLVLIFGAILAALFAGEALATQPIVVRRTPFRPFVGPIVVQPLHRGRQAFFVAPSQQLFVVPSGVGGLQLNSGCGAFLIR